MDKPRDYGCSAAPEGGDAALVMRGLVALRLLVDERLAAAKDEEHQAHQSVRGGRVGLQLTLLEGLA